ncbi:MAG TPA: membrane protein insertase YidC [Terracidiphilus sp.]|nr:membrane protein insertase YidC [Terracidiphilus sp.]
MPEFQNPNLQAGGPGDNRGGDFSSLMLMGFLAVAIFLGWQYFQRPKTNAPEPASTQQQQQQSSSQAPAPAQSSETESASSAAAAKSRAIVTPNISAAGESTTIIDNPNFRIEFTNRGALVKHWILKHYNDSTGHPLDMVQQQASARFGFPLSLFTYEPALTTELNQALYQPSATGTLHAPASLTFHYAQNGVDVLKTFTFDSSYVIHAEVQVHRNGEPVRALLAWPAGLGDQEEFQGRSSIPGLTRTRASFDWCLDGKSDYETSSKIGNDATLEGDYQYAAASDLYFAAAFLPDVPQQATVVTLHKTIDLPTDLSNPNSQKKPADVVGVAVGDVSGDTRLRLYAGPKQMELVSGVHSTGADGKLDGPSLRPLIQFGWLTVLATPLFWALRFTHEHGITNWGWDIIFLTVLFNFLLLPTRLMMMKSSLKMMRIQHKIEALKRKYSHLKATDPKRSEMNQEMMALYKQEGINPYGGCLPMLLQMPLFFAYYRVLLNTVELRQASWWWLKDLSAPDPLHILPVFIIITMFLTQFITPSPGMDPSQRRMMAIVMPLIFGFTLMGYPSGLALYWVTGNLIMLTIQIGINNSHIGKEMHDLAAKRAARKAGLNPKNLSKR